MSSVRFSLILDSLSMIRDYAPWADDDRRGVLGQLKQLKMDLRFLTLFCECLESWEWDEQSRIRLRSTVTAFRLLWVETGNGLIQNRLFDTWPVDAQAFHSVAFALEGRIQKSKLQVEQWCEYLVRSPSMKPMVSESSSYIRPFLSSLRNIIIDSFSATKIVPILFKNQIRSSLNDRLAFLDAFLDNLDGCTQSEILLRSMNFAGAFAINAACLACLYWAKEANEEEIASEMNIVVVFNMLHKFIPYAPDVTMIISQNLRDSSDSIVISTTVASSVDFFFEHLGDDFLILRVPLILLFTSLAANPFHQNAAAEEEDVPRSQVYALFREHSYLLLSIGEMKDVFSDKNMLLSDFTAQIQIANAKLRHFYYGSFSCIGLEAEKTDYMYFVSVARELDIIEKHVKWADLVRSQLRLYRMELTFMRPFLLCFTTWDDTDEKVREKFSFMITSLQGIWQKQEAEKGLLAARFHAIHRGDAADWHPLASELEGKIQLSKVEMEAWCINLRHWSFQFKPSTSYKIVEILDSILNILNDLVTYKADKIVPFKKQIETLEEKLAFLKNVLKLTANCIESKELGEFKMFVQAFANDAACLTFLYWAKDTDGKIAPELSPMLSHMLQKINPVTPDVARLYLRALKAIYLQQCNSLLFGQTASIFVDFFIENHLGTPSKDDFQILHDEVIFLLTFLNDPPIRNSGEVIFSHIDDLFWEDLYGILPFDDTKRDFVKKKMLLNDFLIKIGTVNAKIRQLYSEFPDSSLYNFPKVISPSFLDFIIQNLRNLKEMMISDRKYVPFAKYKITKIVEELVSLRPFFNYIFDLQSELNETWSEVVNLVHLTEHIINLCISSWFVFDHPLWHHMANLSGVIDRIKVIKTKLEKIKENTMYNARYLPRSTSLISSLSEQARPSKINEIFVGFEDEQEKIIGKLICQHKSLDIVSIVGMGGLGKTTLAKQVYGSSSVKCNFDVFAFCSVSQHHNIRRLLRDILRDIMEDDKRIFDMTEDDLAHQLWKCLSRQKYLVVLDNIWDVRAWNEVKSSFPDDNNGSRVVFTTRSREVAENCKINCIPHQLRFLSEEESWELLQRKVFPDGISPPYFHEIGKVIAKNCKGLPLAVAVIAGLLARTEKSPKWWGEVSERVVSYLSDGGCMKILELSYKNLPEILKPCLLFLAAFPEGIQIKVEKVILLWIAEGFVQESKTKSLEDVAKDYFHNLVDRSLVIVSARSSNGGIKSFRVHDLIYELCQTKCGDGNFFWLDHGLAPSSSSDHSIIEHYRVSMRKHNYISIACRPPVSNARSLLIFCEQREFPLRELRLVQVLELDLTLREYDMKQVSSLIHLRHLHAYFSLSDLTSIPQSICNIWNIGSLTLDASDASIRLPATFWKMKSLRHVKVKNCILGFSDGHENEAYPKLDKVVCFSKPVLSTGKDVQRLLLRLPAVRKLSCCLEKSPSDDKESVEILVFQGELESLKLTQSTVKRQYLIHFPTTLKELTLQYFELLWTDISAIAELHCLEVLKLQWVSIRETRLEMEDVAFQKLKFFEIIDYNLVEWNASTESLPCLEQLVIDCPELEVLPPCFGEISALKRIEVICERRYPPKVESSTFRIWEEQMELGNEVEVSILKMPWCL